MESQQKARISASKGKSETTVLKIKLTISRIFHRAPLEREWETTMTTWQERGKLEPLSSGLRTRIEWAPAAEIKARTKND
jgi:general stress protein 26